MLSCPLSSVVCVYLGFRQQALLLQGHQATGALVGWGLWIMLAELGLHFHSISPARANQGTAGLACNVTYRTCCQGSLVVT